jgi:DNA polymerase III subunit delta'
MMALMDETEDFDNADGEGRAEEAPPVPAPRENPLLLSHAAAEAALLHAYASGRLPHAWLITGPRGIGKATLAFRFARFLFAEGESTALFAAPPTSLAVAPEHPIFRRVASGGVADLLVVERGLDPRRKRRRSEIVVEDTRAIASFLRLTPAEGRWRVVIVDGADTMNNNAANALLKILEEPPKYAVLLLVSDNPGRLLPTIRSRCRRFPLKPLPDAIVLEALARYRPDLASSDRAALAGLAEGSIGRVLELATAGGLMLHRTLAKLLNELPNIDGAALHGFADQLARGDGEDGFRLLAELLPGWVARMVAASASEAGTLTLAGEGAMSRLVDRRDLDRWVEVWEKLGERFTEADDLNLDRKQVVLNAFFALQEALR